MFSVHRGSRRRMSLPLLIVTFVLAFIGSTGLAGAEEMAGFPTTPPTSEPLDIVAPGHVDPTPPVEPGPTDFVDDVEDEPTVEPGPGNFVDADHEATPTVEPGPDDFTDGDGEATPTVEPGPDDFVDASPEAQDLEIGFDLFPPETCAGDDQFIVLVDWKNAQPGAAPDNTINTVQGLQVRVFQSENGQVMDADQVDVIFGTTAGADDAILTFDVTPGTTHWDVAFFFLGGGIFHNKYFQAEAFDTQCEALDLPEVTPDEPVDPNPTGDSDTPAVADEPPHGGTLETDPDPVVVTSNAPAPVVQVAELPVTGGGSTADRGHGGLAPVFALAAAGCFLATGLLRPVTERGSRLRKH